MHQPLTEVQNWPQQQLHRSKQTSAMPQHNSSTPMQPASTEELLPVFDLRDFLALQDAEAPSAVLLEQCKQLAECLAKTGCLVVRYARCGF